MRIAPSEKAGRDKKTLRGLVGLNNLIDPMRGKPASPGVGAKTWQLLQQADNVNLTNEGMPTRRDGYSAFLSGSSVTASFSTFDFSRLYIIDSGALKRVNSDGTADVLMSGLTGTAYWAEINDVVYLSCDQKVEIHKDGWVTTWGLEVPVGGRATATTGGQLNSGFYQVAFTFVDETGREGGTSTSLPIVVPDGGSIQLNDIPYLQGCRTNVYLCAKSTVFNLITTLAQGDYTYAGGPLGRELATQFLDAPPAETSHITAFQGRIYAAEYVPQGDMTVVWYSAPLGYHLFNLNEDFFIVPGRVSQMAGSDDTLMLSSESRVFLYNREGLDQVAEYGSKPGRHADIGPDGKLYFWTNRGLCRVSPFENLTESDVSLAPGQTASGGVIQQHGYTRYVVVLKSGGLPFNKR